MPNNSVNFDAETQAAFRANEAAQRLANTKVGCVLVILLMPAGSALDFFVYKDAILPFFYLRIACSIIAGAILAFLYTESGRKSSAILGVIVPLLPAVTIAGMIGLRDGFGSPYYAGLNLVLLAVGAVLNWTLKECLVAVSFVLLIYIMAGLGHMWYEHPPDKGIIFNNFYFLLLMDIIVVVGTYVQERQRFREFSLRFELDRNRKDLEESHRNLEVFNDRLSEQNLALENANREIKEAELQLVQSEKMSSLGRFSAGLMHDILNPLNYARTGLFVLRKKNRKLPPDAQAEADPVINDIDDGLKRVDAIVSDLRSFTHPGGQAVEETDLAELFNTAQRFVSNELNEKKISVQRNLPPGQTICASRNNFITVLVNLLENSIDALAEKKFTAPDAPRIDISSRSEGDRTILTIRDNGTGIAAEILPKIFDPFFTTKEIGKGTGLGLSTCFGIVRGYGGTITAASEPGQYCELTLNLPATTEAAAKPIAEPEHAEPIRL